LSRVNLKGVWNAIHHPVEATSIEGRKELTRRPMVGVIQSKPIAIRTTCIGNLEKNFLRRINIFKKAGLVSGAAAVVIRPPLELWHDVY